MKVESIGKEKMDKVDKILANIIDIGDILLAPKLMVRLGLGRPLGYEIQFLAEKLHSLHPKIDTEDCFRLIKILFEEERLCQKKN